MHPDVKPAGVVIWSAFIMAVAAVILIAISRIRPF
jgi:hypothetical protein